MRLSVAMRLLLALVHDFERPQFGLVPKQQFANYQTGLDRAEANELGWYICIISGNLS